MARIPMGNFGNAMPQVERIQMPQNQTGQMIAGALQNVSQVTDQYAQQKDQQQREAEVSAKRLELYNNQIAEAEAKVKLDDVLTSEMSEQVTLLKNEVSNGSANAAVANESLKKWSDERYKQLEAEMPGHAQQNLKQYWDTNITKQAPGFLPLQLRADVQKSVALVDRVTEIATRYDRKKGREYLESNLVSAQIPEADKQERIYKYESTRDGMDIDDRITSAVSGKNTSDLKTLVTDLDSGKYGYIDGSTAQQKKSQALSRIDAINKLTEVEENKRKTESGKVFNEFKSQVLTGRALDGDYLANVGTAVKGTEHEAEYNFYSQQSNNFQNFSRKSTSDQLALINQQKAKMKNSSTDNAVNEEKILGVYESIHQEKLNTIKDNPNQAVREVGLKVNELSPVELKTNPSSWATKAIDNGVNQLALKDANIKLAPISAEDLPEAKKAFDAMGVNEKLNFIGGVIDQVKGVKNGAGIRDSLLSQLGGADKTYYLAGLAKAKHRKIENENLADAIINGKFLIEKGGYVLPNELENTFRARYGNLANQGNFKDDLKQFQLAYATIANRDGVQHSKKDDEPNTNAINKAFELATGGVYVQEKASWFGSFKTSGGGSFESWKVPKPYGMSDSRFDANLEAGYTQLSKLSGYSVSDLKGLRLAPRIDRNSNLIMYNLLNERNQPLKGKGGKEQFIIFNGVSR